MEKTRRAVLVSILFPVLLLGLLRTFAFDIRRVVGRSMEPTLTQGQVILVNRLAYGLHLPFSSRYIVIWRHPQKGDVLVMPHPTERTLVVKRCIAGEHDRVDPGLVRFFSIDKAVPEGYIAVLGDNQTYSIDSRQYGLVAIRSIYGKVVGR